MNVKLQTGDALLVTDVQRDFLPHGNLAVNGGETVVPALNRYIALARAADLPIFASRDWHPKKHCSFKAQGGPWPEHCVAGTPGAAFPEGLQLPPETIIIDKATTEDKEAYSSFAGTTLAEQLRARGTKRVLVGGLCTDYCVLNTVLDARREGFEVLLLEDAIRAVNLNAGDEQRAKQEMKAQGALPVHYEEVTA